MTEITFTQKSSDPVVYEATIPGFTGVLQVERLEISYLKVFAKTEGCNESVIYNDPESTNTIRKVEIPDSVELRLETDGTIVKAQYEEV